MQISFGDGAAGQYVDLAAKIPAGYTVALLDDGQEPPLIPALVPGVDVRFVGADHAGVRYQLLNPDGDTCGPVHTRPWLRVARIHVY